MKSNAQHATPDRAKPTLKTNTHNATKQPADGGVEDARDAVQLQVAHLELAACAHVERTQALQCKRCICMRMRVSRAPVRVRASRMNTKPTRDDGEKRRRGSSDQTSD